MTPADVLRSAAETLESPARWCRFSFAQNACGMSVSPGHSAAVAWSAYGSLLRHASTRTVGIQALLALADHLDIGSVSGVIRWSNSPRLSHRELLDGLTGAADAWDAGSKKRWAAIGASVGPANRSTVDPNSKTASLVTTGGTPE